MISYEPFYKTLKSKGVSTYCLINKHGVIRILLDRLKHNRPLSAATIDELCKILCCNVSNILEYKPDSQQ